MNNCLPSCLPSLPCQGSFHLSIFAHLYVLSHSALSFSLQFRCTNCSIPFTTEKGGGATSWPPGLFGSSGPSLYCHRPSVLHGTSQGTDTDVHTVFIAKWIDEEGIRVILWYFCNMVYFVSSTFNYKSTPWKEYSQVKCKSVRPSLWMTKNNQKWDVPARL